MIGVLGPIQFDLMDQTQHVKGPDNPIGLGCDRIGLHVHLEFDKN